ncbi:MAG: efflux RND transporter periplasmic adaptor subunit, partial [Shewanella sp.]
MDHITQDSWRTIGLGLFTLVCLTACQQDALKQPAPPHLPSSASSKGELPRAEQSENQLPENALARNAWPSVVTAQLIPEASYQSLQTYSGTLRAGNTTGIGFELSGKLSQLLVDSGAKVTRGQVLARLDTRQLEAERQEILANLAQNEANINLASSTLKRHLELQKSGYVAEQLLDENRNQLSQLEAAKQGLLALKYANQLKLDKSLLLSPFDGTISQRHHSLGEVVHAASPVFTVVGHINPEAYIGVPVILAQQFTPGQDVNISVQNQYFKAKIAGVSAEVNPISRTLELRISLPAAAAVINGDIAYLHHAQTIAEPGYWVPIAALSDAMRGRWQLYVVKDNPLGANVEPR